MRRIIVSETGARPTLQSGPVPEPAEGEVRIRIAACGLNFADLLMIDGRYQDTPPTPFIPGLELAGTVEALGPGMTGPAPGTRVAVYAGQGGLAEAGCFRADRCLPIPDSMSFAEAAGFQVAYGTSHLALRHAARLAEGETLLVLGASGGVGLTAVELGRLMGARVIAVARGADKLAIAQAAGATHLIDSDSADLRTAVKDLGGADVVFDPVGGPAFEAAMRATRPAGRLLVIGFAGGTVQQIPANHLLVKNISVIGFYWGGYRKFAPQLLRASLAELLEWYEAGRLRPHISHRLPLERATEGLELLRRREATGKVVVEMDQAAFVGGNAPAAAKR